MKLGDHHTPATRATISASMQTRHKQNKADGIRWRNFKEREHYRRLAVYWAQRAVAAEQMLSRLRHERLV